MSDQYDKDSFNAGYLVACANIMHLHGEDTVGSDVLRELGLSRADLTRLTRDNDYDGPVLRKLYREMR